MSRLCHEVLENALGHPVKPEDADRLFAKLQRHAAALRTRNRSLSYNDSIQQAAAEIGEQLKANAEHARLVRALNASRKLQALNYLETTWADDPGQGLKALLVGTQDARMGARSSIGADQDAIASQYVGGLIADVAKVDGGLDTFADGVIDDEVAEVLWALSENKAADLSQFGELAGGVGRAVRKWQDVGRLDANKSGAFIRETRGFVTTTFHDGVRIARDRDTWMEMAHAHFDLDRMAEAMGIDAKDMQSMLSGIWHDLADGQHLRLDPAEAETFEQVAFNLGRKLSKHRVVHFKGAASWSAYNRQFGAGNLREAVVWGLQRQARATALMNGLGPTYEQNYDALGELLINRLKERGAAPAVTAQLSQDLRSYKRLYLAQLDGSLDIAGSDTVATISSTIRGIQSMASLGGSVLTSVSDLGVMALGARYNDLNPLQLISRGVGELFRGVPSAERLALQADLGVVLGSLSGKLSLGRFTPEDDVRGWVATAQHHFFTWNLQNRWTDAMREAVAELLSANMARRLDTAYDQLGDLKTTLGLYGIDAGRWDIVRRAPTTEIEGSRFLSPRAIEELDDAPFADYLAARETEVSPGAVRQLRNELQRQLRAYFADQNGYLLLTPDAATRGMIKQGTQRGTGVGEAVRFIMQFKSFPLAFSQRIIGRELKQGGVFGIASMIAWVTLLGYASNVLKDAAKLRTQRDPTDYRTWIAAMQNGGGWGLYGDLLFSQVLDRRFADAGLQLFGPTASDAFGSRGLAGIAARAAQGEDAKAAGVRFVQGNAPMLNLFWLKPILDYGIFYRLQEWMNPGSLRRMEAEIEQRTGQRSIVPPSEVVP